MSTQVELLYDTEVENDHPENLEEAVKLLTEMGLTEQLALYTQKDKVHEIEFPFFKASNEQLFTYRFHFPQTIPLDNYKEPMPLRVLEVLKKAKDSNRFTDFQVWTKNDGSYRSDPVLIGRIKVSEYQGDFYLLARWGDALEDYSKLLASAIQSYKLELENQIAQATNKLVSFGKLLSRGNFVPRLSYQSWSKPPTLRVELDNAVSVVAPTKE